MLSKGNTYYVVKSVVLKDANALKFLIIHLLSLSMKVLSFESYSYYHLHDSYRLFHYLYRLRKCQMPPLQGIGILILKEIWCIQG